MDNVSMETLFMTIELKNNVFAVPAKHTLGIVKWDRSIPYTVLPQERENVKGIMEMDDQFVTIVNIPGTYENGYGFDSSIVVLGYGGQNIGILTKEARLITISEDKILEDKITGTKFFEQEGKMYIILDIGQLYEELGI